MSDEVKKTASLARNWISFLGLTIAVIAAINIAFLVLADIGSEHVNPYVGVMAYVLVPGVMVFGLLVFLAGVLIERRRRRRHAPDDIPRYPAIDLNNPKTRRIFMVTAIALTVFVMVSIVGSYKAYHYTDSDAFCGTMCHQIMHPQYTAYSASPHARVGCVNCHIGSGATWFVKSKLSGAYQVYATVAEKYPKPIPTPVENLRPAQQTCEQCHWPEKFWGAQLKVFNHFGYDETNTPRETRLLIKTGGGSPSGGLTAGIHWHMNISNEITYVASDRQRQNIEWVRMRDRSTGRTVEYTMEGATMTAEQIAAAPKRLMDCVDCHNRPAHIYEPPDRAVDMLLLGNRINRTLPFIKQQAVATMTKEYESTDQAVRTIAEDINRYYQESYPEIYQTRKNEIDRAVIELQSSFKTTRFPEMKVDWRTHPNNVGHFYSPGCFRCHTDQHKSADGKVITKDCQICHSVIGQAEAGVVMVEVPTNEFQHPIDLGDMREMTCTECHTGASM
ncbi:MAG TPA: NapC/NirT family cytochrome c [Thermoanaerobaculia bacterium]|nr:NapC/NirT family cytochrome c [Thermoanaerobaculia bacterium]